jgi:hypothetical protein
LDSCCQTDCDLALVLFNNLVFVVFTKGGFCKPPLDSCATGLAAQYPLRFGLRGAKRKRWPHETNRYLLANDFRFAQIMPQKNLWFGAADAEGQTAIRNIPRYIRLRFSSYGRTLGMHGGDYFLSIKKLVFFSPSTPSIHFRIRENTQDERRSVYSRACRGVRVSGEDSNLDDATLKQNCSYSPVRPEGSESPSELEGSHKNKSFSPHRSP